MGKFLLGFLLALLLIPAAAYVYLRFGHPPVAVGDHHLPYEKMIVHVPLNARIDRERPANAPFTVTPAVLTAGAEVYTRQCAFCHGVPAAKSPIGNRMYPHAPQLWAAHGNVVGVSDDPVGETYWKVKNGIRLAGMPAYDGLLSDEQIWQVSLLVASADKPLQPDVQKLLAAQ